MTPSSITPITSAGRIQTIDIIRGIALLGIIIINFTTDSMWLTPVAGQTTFSDHVIYWAIRLLIDDRFQSIYCFLFGLGFAIQMQRAIEKNAPFTFIFLRRMLALFVIGCAFHIFFTWSYVVLPFYAIIGIWLLLFRKVPIKFLPLFAVFFFVLSFSINTITKINAVSEIKTETKKRVAVDTTVLDKYAGVYQIAENINVIFFRKGDSLIGEDPRNRLSLAPLSDSQFVLEDNNTHYTFMKEASGDVKKIKYVYVPTGYSRVFTRIQEDLQVALKQQLEQRAEALKASAAGKTYRKHVKRNFDVLWNYLKAFPWQNFVWKGTYEVGYILVLFILGLYAGRKKIFYDVAANKQFLQKTFKWGLILGAPPVLFLVGLEMWDYFNGIKAWQHYSAMTNAMISIVWNLGIIVLTMAYIAGLILLLEYMNWKKRLSFFGTVGRLGLTNYGLHLFANLLIFENVNLFLGLDGKVGHIYRLPIAILVYVVLYFFSSWWLRHFEMGPFEWLWRSMTYWKWQPMRKKDEMSVKTGTF